MNVLHKAERHKKTLHHINRIEGQIKVLKKYIEEGKSCQKIAQLTASITQSFSALQIRTLEGFIRNQLLEEEINEEKRSQLESLLKLYKK